MTETLTPLRRVFRIVNGGTPTSDPKNWGGEVAWATPIDLAKRTGRSISATQRSLTLSGLDSGSSSVPEGSLIVSSRAPIGYVTETTCVMAFNQGCKGLVPVQDVDVRFFRHQLSAIGEQLQALGQGSTFLELSADALASVRIAVPPLSTQQQLADYLDTETAHIDTLINKKLEIIGLLCERRISLTIEACIGRFGSAWERKESSLPWAISLPSHWREVLLRGVAEVGTGHTPSRDHPEWWEDCTIPWVTTGEVSQMRSDQLEFLIDTREKVSHKGIANSSAVIHPAGTVMLSRTASPGYSAIMASKMSTSQDFVTWTCGPLLRPRFLLLCLRAMRGDLLGRLAIGSTHKTIYMPDILGIRVPLPKTEEQDDIVERTWSELRIIDESVTKLEHQVMLLRERRVALIISVVANHRPTPKMTA